MTEIPFNGPFSVYSQGQTNLSDRTESMSRLFRLDKYFNELVISEYIRTRRLHPNLQFLYLLEDLEMMLYGIAFNSDDDARIAEYASKLCAVVHRIATEGRYYDPTFTLAKNLSEDIGRIKRVYFTASKIPHG